MAVSQSYESRELHSQISDIHYDIRLICKMGVIYKMGAEVCTCTGFLQVNHSCGCCDSCNWLSNFKGRKHERLGRLGGQLGISPARLAPAIRSVRVFEHFLSRLRIYQPIVVYGCCCGLRWQYTSGSHNHTSGTMLV